MSRCWSLDSAVSQLLTLVVRIRLPLKTTVPFGHGVRTVLDKPGSSNSSFLLKSGRNRLLVWPVNSQQLLRASHIRWRFVRMELFGRGAATRKVNSATV